MHGSLKPRIIKSVALAEYLHQYGQDVKKGIAVFYINLIGPGVMQYG